MRTAALQLGTWQGMALAPAALAAAASGYHTAIGWRLWAHAERRAPFAVSGDWTAV